MTHYCWSHCCVCICSSVLLTFLDVFHRKEGSELTGNLVQPHKEPTLFNLLMKNTAKRKLNADVVILYPTGYELKIVPNATGGFEQKNRECWADQEKPGVDSAPCVNSWLKQMYWSAWTTFYNHHPPHMVQDMFNLYIIIFWQLELYIIIVF